MKDFFFFGGIILLGVMPGRNKKKGFLVTDHAISLDQWLGRS